MASLDPDALDLNQLRALHALLEEGHVARAAQRLGITPPAASNAMRQLRLVLNDPLLVRAGNRMVLTPLAERLRTPLAKLMADVQRLLANAHAFDPQKAGGEIRIATSDHVASSLVLLLQSELDVQSPNIDLRLEPMPKHPARWLESGGDLVISPVGTSDQALRCAALFDDEFMCVVAQNHPFAEIAWTPAMFASLSHVLVTPRARHVRGEVDDALEALGLSRRITTTVPTFSLALTLVEGSARVTTLPAQYVRSQIPNRRLLAKTPPVALPKIRIFLIWHPRNQDDARHQWLRELVRHVGGKVSSRGTGPGSSPG